MGQRKSQRYVETLLNEAVTDVDQRDIWRESRGLCHWHAWMATETPHSAGSVAILYADVLHRDLRASRGADGCRTSHTALAFASRTGATLAGLARAWRQQRRCPVCSLWREQEQLYLHVLWMIGRNRNWRKRLPLRVACAGGTLCA